MQALLEQTTMPITEERIKGLETQNQNIRERLSKIEGSIEALPRESKAPHWATGVLVAMVLAWMGWLSLQIIGMDGKVKAITFILNPQETLKTLTSAVSPEPQKAKRELAQVTDSLHKLTTAKVSLPEQTVDQATAQLSEISTTHQDLPETWSAIGAFITYRSQMIQGWGQTNLPTCDDQFHRFRITAPMTKDAKGQPVLTHGPVEIHDCKIVLDSLGASRNLSLDLSLADIVFTHCAVFYNGGPVVLVPVKVATETPAHLVGSLTFHDSFFIVSLPQVPSASGQELARLLLTSPKEEFKLNWAS